MDPGNILQFFESPVRIGDPAQAGNNPIHRTHFGRLKASKFFHRLEVARKDKKLWGQLHSINASYKGYLCQKLIIEKLNYDMNQAMDRKRELERNLDNLISQAACTYTVIENPSIRAENIISGAANVGPEIRQAINLNSRL